VLAENIEFVQNKYERRKKEKFDDLSAFNDYKSRIESDDFRRQTEREAREDRIKRLLNRVPTVTVEQASVVHEQEIERKVKEHQLQREQFEEQLLQKKREDTRRKNEDMVKRLDMQIEEKKARHQ
jgi:hypothetical protein